MEIVAGRGITQDMIDADKRAGRFRAAEETVLGLNSINESPFLPEVLSAHFGLEARSQRGGLDEAGLRNLIAARSLIRDTFGLGTEQVIEAFTRAERRTHMD